MKENSRSSSTNARPSIPPFLKPHTYKHQNRTHANKKPQSVSLVARSPWSLLTDRYKRAFFCLRAIFVRTYAIKAATLFSFSFGRIFPKKSQKKSFGMNLLLSAILKFCTTNQLFQFFRKRYNDHQLKIGI